MAKKKYYVVWKGIVPGVYRTWDDCKRQIDGFAGALYKSFETENAALAAFQKGLSGFQKKGESQPLLQVEKTSSKPIKESIAVDGAWNTKTLESEYRGVDVKTGKQLFLKGPYADGTNNIMEFLAIVHALAYCKRHQINRPIYSDSMTALKWVSTKKANTKLVSTGRNDELFELIDRAEEWLKSNTYVNKLLKWETQIWGENPADFGRK